MKDLPIRGLLGVVLGFPFAAGNDWLGGALKYVSIVRVIVDSSRNNNLAEHL